MHVTYSFNKLGSPIKLKSARPRAPMAIFSESLTVRRGPPPRRALAFVAISVSAVYTHKLMRSCS